MPLAHETTVPSCLSASTAFSPMSMSTTSFNPAGAGPAWSPHVVTVPSAFNTVTARHPIATLTALSPGAKSPPADRLPHCTTVPSRFSARQW